MYILVLIVNIVGKWMVTEDSYNTINYNNYTYIKTYIKTSGTNCTPISKSDKDFYFLSHSWME